MDARIYVGHDIKLVQVSDFYLEPYIGMYGCINEFRIFASFGFGK